MAPKSNFHEKVLNIVSRIPEGRTMTYGEVARAAGNPRAARAVGSVLRMNYDPQIPCHRVIYSDGSPGGYNRGILKKKAILRKEMALGRVLTATFFKRPTLQVAKDILGKYLVRKSRGRTRRYLITEVEGYDGWKDKASHAHRGQTKRNAPMFGPAGYFYVYFTYGMHWMLNIVVGERGYPAAILIRGVSGIPGPARLTRALKINGKLNGKQAAKKSNLWFEDGGVIIKRGDYARTPRIGVDYAGKVWAEKPYRFVLKQHI